MTHVSARYFVPQAERDRDEYLILPCKDDPTIPPAEHRDNSLCAPAAFNLPAFGVITALIGEAAQT